MKKYPAFAELETERSDPDDETFHLPFVGHPGQVLQDDGRRLIDGNFLEGTDELAVVAVDDLKIVSSDDTKI